MHTHTIFSGHAYSTIRENVDVATERDLKYIFCTDHYLQFGSKNENLNEDVRIKFIGEHLNKDKTRTNVFPSAEFNLFQEVNKGMLETLRWKPIGLHSWFTDYKTLTLKEIENEYRKSVGKFTAFNHIERDLYRFASYPEITEHLKRVVDIAVKNKIYLEVNESSLGTYGRSTAEYLRFWLEYAKEKGALLCLGSDAHYCNEVGDFTKTLELLNDVGYSKYLILNCNEDLLRKYLK